jgi:hypothetical protein
VPGKPFQTFTKLVYHAAMDLHDHEGVSKKKDPEEL